MLYMHSLWHWVSDPFEDTGSYIIFRVGFYAMWSLNK